jgi:hypothetical protein
MAVRQTLRQNRTLVLNPSPNRSTDHALLIWPFSTTRLSAL